MSRDRQALSHHPAPQTERLSTPMTFFMLFGGPAAWLVQLCIGDALLSWPCFPSISKLSAPTPGYDWTGTAAWALLLAATGVALAATLLSGLRLRELKDEDEGGHAELMHVGHGRTRFIALWGVILGAGFAVATLATVAGFALVPRCAG